MGWARTLFLGDIGNRLDIEDTERDIAELRRELRRTRRLDRSQEESIVRLQQETEQLELCVAALTRVLESRAVLSHDEVTNLVSMIEEATE